MTEISAIVPELEDKNNVLINNKIKRELFGVLEQRFFALKCADNIKEFINQCERLGIKIILDGRHLVIYINEQDFNSISEVDRLRLHNLSQKQDNIDFIFGYDLNFFKKIK